MTYEKRKNLDHIADVSKMVNKAKLEESLADERFHNAAQANARLEGERDKWRGIAERLAEATTEKLGALQYDIWFLKGHLEMGTYKIGQEDLVKKAYAEMVEAQSKCESALTAYDEAKGESK